MRILQIVQKPQRRGAETFAFELSKQLRNHGQQVQTIYLYPYSGDKPLELIDGDLVLNGKERHFLEKIPGAHPALAKALNKSINEFDPDVVQVNGARTLKYGALAKRLRGRQRKWKLIYRNIDVPSFWNRKFLKIQFYRHLIMPRMDGVIGVSEMCLRDVIDLYKMKVPAEAILNGIDETKLNPSDSRANLRAARNVKENEVVLLFVGSMVEQKRPDRFLQVFAQLARETQLVKAWLVGDGHLRQESERLADELGISKNCTFFGYQEQVADFMAAADIFVMSSDTEGVPAVVLEAGHMELPVVATDVGGMRECVQHQQTGLLVGQPFEQELFQALSELVNAAQQRLQMGANGRKWVDETCTMSITADKYLGFYKRITDSVE